VSAKYTDPLFLSLCWRWATCVPGRRPLTVSLCYRPTRTLCSFYPVLKSSDFPGSEDPGLGDGLLRKVEKCKTNGRAICGRASCVLPLRTFSMDVRKTPSEECPRKKACTPRGHTNTTHLRYATTRSPLRPETRITPSKHHGQVDGQVQLWR
jgi:hypothetical protein